MSVKRFHQEKTIVKSNLKVRLGERVFIKLQPLYLSLWRACPELVSGEIKREDKNIRNLINTRYFTFDSTLVYKLKPKPLKGDYRTGQINNHFFIDLT